LTKHGAALAALLACMLAGCAAHAATRLLVQPRVGVTLKQLDELLSPHGGRRVDAIAQINVHIVELPSEADACAAALKLKNDPRIESVEFDQRVPPSLAPDGANSAFNPQERHNCAPQ
jgi:hypothetical protein